MKLLCVVGRNINWCSHYEEQDVWKFLKKLTVEVPYDPGIGYFEELSVEDHLGS